MCVVSGWSISNLFVYLSSMADNKYVFYLVKMFSKVVNTYILEIDICTYLWNWTIKAQGEDIGSLNITRRKEAKIFHLIHFFCGIPTCIPTTASPNKQINYVTSTISS